MLLRGRTIRLPPPVREARYDRMEVTMRSARIATVTAIAAISLAFTLIGCGASSTGTTGGERPQPEA